MIECVVDMSCDFKEEKRSFLGLSSNVSIPPMSGEEPHNFWRHVDRSEKR